MKKRESFGKIKEVYDVPDLLEIQYESYVVFLQKDIAKARRENVGLEEALRSVFPIESQDGNYKLEYINYIIGKPKYDISECQRRGMTFAAPLRIKLRLRSKKDTKEQEVYMGDIPLMTPTGTFVVNGDERVVVSQLHRSPGVSFEASNHASGKRLFMARLIPYRGAWIEFEFDINDILHVFIDRRRKFLATTFLRILGYSQDRDILKAFDELEKIEFSRSGQLKTYIGKVLASDVLDPNTKTVLIPKGQKLTTDNTRIMWNTGVRNMEVIKGVLPEIAKTLEKDRTHSREEALIDIYRKLRPGDPPNLEVSETLVNRLFFDPKRYDMHYVGRHMLNRKLEMKASLTDRTLTPETVSKAIKKLIALKNGEGTVDDIDHLGNRRIRTVGELLQNQMRIGLVRMERAARERMNIYNLEDIMPHSLINAKLVSSVIRDFFGRSQLSQFMDQTNPLAELTHKRRLSALGPGGLNRERAGFEVRDVHYSHYGRMCPIETPEGPNIGLISSLSTYARVNKFGFLETPYRLVANGVVTNKIDYLSADSEDQFIIAQANAPIDSKGRFTHKEVFCRYKRDFIKAAPKEVQYMDVSPKQLVSVAASMIPFLEHDDANRALMGSNMQRQAVPLLTTEAPLIGTGMEHRAAKDSGAAVTSESQGKVTAVQADEVVVSGKRYPLRKFDKSNASTSVNQRPIVSLGDKVKQGQIIADGPGTSNGELALGRNVLVAFMPWLGYNFEDAIVVSEKLVKEDVYTSIHIEEFEIEARETRLGNEEITRDIPNVGEELLNNLDERGIIRVGAEVGPGDILVGKIAPKSETELSPEEKLLRAIFGEKAGDVRDASLTVPPGVEGIVIDVKLFSRKELRGRSKDEKTKELKEIHEVRKHFSKEIEKIGKDRQQKLVRLLIGKKLGASLLDNETGHVVIAQGKTIRKKDIKDLERCDFDDIKLIDSPQAESEVKQTVRILDDEIENLTYETEREVDRIKRGDELPAGVLKRIVVHVASKRKLSVGDKMAGRHGNKGVIAKIVPDEDMPYLPDGTPVEIILNPLGVPSRMNVGQLLETHLGWAAKVLGFSVASPVFDGASEKEIKELLKKAKLPEDGKIILRNGKTGKSFDEKVAVGYIYMMKLAHLVDDKIHARSIGPYSLVTQQPLGGKAQFGGQRFGEMEVWAFEAYGAAYTLQELLTVKSDDVLGRTRIYESIVKGEHALHCGTPESFNVLVKELQSLCLDVRTEKLDESGKPIFQKPEKVKKEKKGAFASK